MNYRVQKFSPDGEFIAAWGSQGSADGQFEFPIDVAVDDDGWVYALDWINDEIQSFEPVS